MHYYLAKEPKHPNTSHTHNTEFRFRGVLVLVLPGSDSLHTRPTNNMGGNQSRQYHQYHPHSTADGSNTSSSHHHPGWHGGFASWRRGPIFGGWQPRDHHGWEDAAASPLPRRQHRSMVSQHHTILRQLPTITLERDAVDLLAMKDEDDNDSMLLYPTTKAKSQSSRYYPQHQHYQQQQQHYQQQQQQQHHHALENVTCGECLICLLSYQKGDTLVSLSCGHSYHKDCLQEWFVRQCVCPYCRHDVEHEYTTTMIAKKVKAFQDGNDPHKWDDYSSWLFFGGNPHAPHARFFQHGSSPSSSRRSYYYHRQDGSSAQVLLLSPYDDDSSNENSSSNTTTSSLLSLVNVLRRRQDVWKHAEHQRTVLEQLSFSSSSSSSSTDESSFVLANHEDDARNY